VTDFSRLLAALADGGVEFIVVGGLAAVAHGAARLTQDVDVVYSRSAGNIRRLVKAMTPLTPYLRGAPRGLPFNLDEETMRRGLNFTLTTVAGDIDLLGEIVGGGGFEDLKSHTVSITLFGKVCLCLDLPTLIRVKRAAGRARDLEAISELEALLEESS
jgi:hypothetical protein